MLPKERVLAAVARETPDRTPCDFWAEPPALNRLLEYLGHTDEDRLLTALNVDIRHLNASHPPEREVRSGVYQNFWGERYVYQPTPWGKMREDIPGALAELKTRCRRHEDFALLYGFADVWQRPALVRGWEGMFLDMTERPHWVHFLGRKFTDFYIEDYTRAAEISRGKIDIYLLISDLGSQNGPLVSLGMFRRFIAPYLKEMIDHVHSLGALVLFHSCGAIRPFIPDLISLGIDVLDPIQPIGPEMTPERLKADFGDRLSFHGGIDMQQLLPNSTPERVRREARRYCEILGRGGGYILAPAHLFQPDVPPENILALYQ
jgi:uroporphyrinogen decarboxylase